MIYNRHYVLTVADRRLNAQYIYTLFVVHALCNVPRSGFWLLLFFRMWPWRRRRCCCCCSCTVRARVLVLFCPSTFIMAIASLDGDGLRRHRRANDTFSKKNILRKHEGDFLAANSDWCHLQCYSILCHRRLFHCWLLHMAKHWWIWVREKQGINLQCSKTRTRTHTMTVDRDGRWDAHCTVIVCFSSLSLV